MVTRCLDWHHYPFFSLPLAGEGWGGGSEQQDADSAHNAQMRVGMGFHYHAIGLDVRFKPVAIFARTPIPTFPRRGGKE